MKSTEQPPSAETPPMPAIVNGRWGTGADAVVRGDDEGLLRGDGAFEVVVLYQGRPFALLQHLERLQKSCAVLRLPQPDVGQLRQRIALLIERASNLETCALRIVITRGGAELLLLEPHLRATDSLRLLTMSHEPASLLVGAKSLSYAENMLARRLARERGADEALFVNRGGCILEATTSSFFWVDETGQLCTPPISDGVLDSITRRVIVEDLRVVQRSCNMTELAAVREAFLAGTIREIQSVIRIDDHTIAVVDGEMTVQARRAFFDAVERDAADHRGAGVDSA